MSDFLTNLVTRSLGAAPVIQPRLPSLFEPSTPYPGPFAGGRPRRDVERVEVREQAEFEGADDVPLAPQERQASANRFAIEGNVRPKSWRPVAQPSDSDEAIRGPAKRQSENVAVLPPREIFPEGTPIVRLDVAEVSSAEKPVRASNQSSNSPGEIRRQIPVKVPAAPQRNVPAGDFIAPAVVPHSVAMGLDQSTEQPHRTKRVARNLDAAKTDHFGQFHETPQLHETPALVELERSRIGNFAPRATAETKPVPARHLEFARHVPLTAHASRPEPTVQVTIGRIEVRAVSPQAGSAKERPASPVMSLTDYLRSKRGGA